MSYSTNYLIGRFLGDGPSDPTVSPESVDIYGNPIRTYAPAFDQESGSAGYQSVIYNDAGEELINLSRCAYGEYGCQSGDYQTTPAFQNSGGREINVFATRAQVEPQLVDTRIVDSLATFNAPAPPPPAPPPVWAVGPQHPTNVYQSEAYQAWTPAPAPAPAPAPFFAAPAPAPAPFFAAPAPAPAPFFAAPAPAPAPASSGGGFTLAPPGFPVRPRPREGDSTVTYTFDANGDPVPVEPAQESASGSGGRSWLALAALAALAFMS